ncbi:hypothetical protein KAU33_02360 [Candidatus Dependentiae bacterium]|nr:hypothetical protein [Candidatus Dependentiae bacterium]
MKFSDKQYQLIILGLGFIVLALLCLQFEVNDVVKASLENNENDVWTSEETRYLHSPYNESVVGIDVLATFHNNKKLKSDSGSLIECIMFNFKLTQVTDTNETIELQEEDVELVPFGESYDVDFSAKNLPEDETLYLKLTATGLGVDEKGSSCECEVQEYVLFTLEPQEQPISMPIPEETPGFEAVFAIASLLLVIFIAKKE